MPDEDPTSAFGFWIDGYGNIHDIESFYSTHSAIACRYVGDNPGACKNFSHVAMQYRRVNREIFPADYLMIDKGWIRVLKNIQARFLALEFYEKSVSRQAARRLTTYLKTYCLVRSIKIDVRSRTSSENKFYLVDGDDINGVIQYIDTHIKRAADDIARGTETVQSVL